MLTTCTRTSAGMTLFPHVIGWSVVEFAKRSIVSVNSWAGFLIIDFSLEYCNRQHHKDVQFSIVKIASIVAVQEHQLLVL